MSTHKRSFGTRALRVEDPALLTGKGRFLDDIYMPGTLTAAFLRSPHAHAAIRAIDASAAAIMPGVAAIYTIEELEPHLTADRTPLGQSVREIAGLSSRSLRDNITPYVLARDEVCYVGDPIAVVLAESRAVAEDAAACIAIDFEQLPVVADMRGAIAPTRPGPPARGGQHPGRVRDLLRRLRACVRGRRPPALAVAVPAPRLRPSDGRPRRACQPRSAERRTTVWTSTQSPHEIRMSLVQLLGLDDEELRIITPDVGGGFGAKYLIYPEEVVVPLAARLLGRPVRWLEDRREHFLTAIQERDQHWDVEMGLDGDGHILGIRGTLLHDQGAYTPQGINVSYNSATALPGPYRVPAYEMRVVNVETNKVPTMPVRGAGYPQATFAIERLLDLAAAQMNLSSVELPMQSRSAGCDAIRDADEDPCRIAGEVRQRRFPAMSGDGLEASATPASPSARPLRSRTAATSASASPMAPKARDAGRSRPASCASAARAASRSRPARPPWARAPPRMLAQIAADEFNVAPADIHVIAGDTAHVPMGHGGFASRQAVNAGNSVHIAATGVRATTLNVAAELLGTPVEDLELDNGFVRARGRNVSIKLGDIAREAAGIPGYSLPKGLAPGQPGLEHTAHFMPTGLAYSNAAHAVEVEVDPVTGAVTILRYVVVSDCGRQINPMIVEGQITGGVVHGIGNALFEHMGYDGARSRSPPTSPSI